MIDLKTYLEYNKSAEKFALHEDEIIAYNLNLISKYPWLAFRECNPETDCFYVSDSYDYRFTWLDDMPDGWRIAFAEDLCKELQEELERVNFVDEYQIIQVKEKFGGLRWYTGGVPVDSKLNEIAEKYEDLSYTTCICCGKPAQWLSTGWINPYCDDCKNKVNSSVKFVEINSSKEGHVNENN